MKDERPPTTWTTANRKPLVRTPIFRVEEWDCRTPTQRRPRYRYVITSPDWVNIIPITGRDTVVLVQQYRHGIEQMTLEIPGGVMDPEDADPAAAAARELREETGYDAELIEPIGVVAPNPAIQSNRCHSFLATGLQRVGALQLDEGEDLRVIERPLAEVLDALLNGEICHSLVVAAFTFYLLREQSRR